MNILSARTIHVIGSGGIGISGVAKILELRGASITGSDVTDRGHDARNIPVQCDAIIYSGAVPVNNVERKAAHERGIPEFSYSEALGALTRQYRTIAVSGTHGKSTTTAMLGSILIEAGLDPLVLVGTRVANFSHGNVQWGRGELFVVEACEHEAQMMRLVPERIIVTNLEADHLDYYGTYEALHGKFQEYVTRIASEQCVVNYDDKNVMKLFSDSAHQPRTFGFDGGAIRCISRNIADGKQTAQLRDDTGNEFELVLSIPGAFNVMNAMAAFEMARSVGVEPTVALAALQKYPGSWRRFERVGDYHGAPVISDYGHHPTAVTATVNAAKEFFPGHRVLLVYQPHQHHRTGALYGDFIRALSAPDALILNEIYDVHGRERSEDAHVSSVQLLHDIKNASADKPRWYSANLQEAEHLISQHARPDDVIIVMGAGDIYKVADDICSK